MGDRHLVRMKSIDNEMGEAGEGTAKALEQEDELFLAQIRLRATLLQD